MALPHGLAATLAVFDITRRNVVSTDPANAFHQVQTGEERSRGFDANLVWQPLPGLSLLASYAHINARVTKDDLIPVGTRLPSVPRDSGRLWVNYKVQDGLFRNVTFGAGFYAASSQSISLNDSFTTPGFVTVDAKIGYAAKRWQFTLIGKNLFDRRYFVPYPYAQGRAAPGRPLTILARTSIKY